MTLKALESTLDELGKEIARSEQLEKQLTNVTEKCTTKSSNSNFTLI
jgi:hypothetical protein